MAQKTILIVDDEKEITDAFEVIISVNTDHRILKAYGGADGLRLATEEHPDLVLLDIMMPDVDGYEVLRKIKKRQIPTRVIMMTGVRCTLRDVITFIRAGACDYLWKPFSTKELTNAVNRALAMESTINLIVSDTVPIIEGLVARAEKLERDNKKLLERNHWAKVVIRLLYLGVSVSVAILFHNLGIAADTFSLVILTLVLFVLLLLPIERIKNLYTKTLPVETRVEMWKEDAHQNESRRADEPTPTAD